MGSLYRYRPAFVQSAAAPQNREGRRNGREQVLEAPLCIGETHLLEVV
jgi:hypothetical protein